MASFVVLSWGILGVPDARAGSWVFQRSYYSHEPIVPVETGRQSPLRAPYYTRPWGVYTRSGFRQHRTNIRVRGRVFEIANHWDTWYQTGSQY